MQISTKSPANSLFPSMFFRGHPRCFGPLGKFQHNIKISIKTARVSRLYVSYDHSDNKTNFPHKLLLTNRQFSNLGKAFANHL